jgi:hypothetical protein
MAYSKAKLKSSGDKASPVLDHFGKENYQKNVYLYGAVITFWKSRRFCPQYVGNMSLRNVAYLLLLYYSYFVCFI